MIVFDRGALEDLDRIFEFNLNQAPKTAIRHIERIRDGIQVLNKHPEMGRRLPRSSLRELVISFGRTGCVALYEHSPAETLIRVVAVRHRREAGYRDR